MTGASSGPARWSASETGGSQTAHRASEPAPDRLERRENAVGPRIDADRRDERPTDDALRVDDEQRPLALPFPGAVDAVPAGDLALGLEIRKQGEVQLAIGGEGRVAPNPVDGDTEKPCVEARELRAKLVVKRHLVAADGTPIRRVERQDHRPPAQLGQADRPVGGRGQRELGGDRSRRERPGTHARPPLTARASRRRPRGEPARARSPTAIPARGACVLPRRGARCDGAPARRSPLTSSPFLPWRPRGASIRLDQGHVHDMLREEPDLLFVPADDVGHQKVVGPVVAGLRGQAGHGARLLEDDLVRVEQPRHLHRYFLPPLRRTGDDRRLGDVGRHREADPAEHLDPLGEHVDQFVLLLVVLVVEEVQLVEGRARDLPVVLLVHVAKGHRVGEKLLEIRRRSSAGAFGQGDRSRVRWPNGCISRPSWCVNGPGLLDQRLGVRMLAHHRLLAHCSYFSTTAAGRTAAWSGSRPNSRSTRRCRSRSQHWSSSTLSASMRASAQWSRGVCA